MNTEQKQITISAYRDYDGNPTCALAVLGGKCCPFFEVKKFGFVEMCIYTGSSLERREEGIGFTIPDENCPVWNNNNQPNQ